MTDPVDRSCKDDSEPISLSASVLSPGTDTAERDASIEDQVAREKRERLSDRLLTESPTAELVHLLLILIVAIIIWGVVPNSAVFLWVSVVVIVTGLRFFLRRYLCAKGGTAESIYLSMRGSILLSGLAWGVGILLLSGRLGHDELALILVVFAGLVAGATCTLVADRVSFHIFSAAMLLSLIGAILISGSDRFHIFAAFLTVLYGMIISFIHLRSHQQTAGHLEVNIRLELSDILLKTERDREESERKEVEEALRDTEEQYRRLVESTSDMVWEVDLEGKWIFLNGAAENLLGVSRELLLGQSFADFMAPGEIEQGREHFQGVLTGGEMTDYETTFLNSDGEARHLSIAARPIFDSRGVIRGARGIARDATARVATRATLEEARMTAVQMAQARTNFLANMSHEIRTPMNGILGMTELLLDSELAPEQRRSAQLVHTSADALLRIINDILDYSKIESGHFAIEEIPFNLAAVVDSTLRTFISPVFEKGIELVSDIHSDIPEIVMGDPGRHRQVLNNLIGNAVKFTHKGEIAVTVALVSGPDEEEFLHIGVRDTGIGIPEGKLDSIFEEFSQADASTTREYGGTGLGLAISNRIVGLMGGTIEVTSTVGEGSEFSFRVPLKIGESKALPGIGRERIKLNGVRAIVVDDNTTNRRIVREILAAVNILVHEAEDADAGLAMLHQAASEGNAYDLAVIDVYMPGRDGFELAEIIRGDPVLKHTRMMLLTSGARKGDGQRCNEIGIQAYLSKPVSRTDLLEATVMVLSEMKDKLHTGHLVTRHSIEETRQHRRILLAEDNPVNREVASTMLRKRGHTVDTVENGQEAVNAVRDNTYDIVLMDIQMPTMDGITAVREIRSDQQFADLPIIALTAHALEGDEERFLDAGMNGYISKPFRPHQLYAVVEEWTSDPVSDSAGRQTEDSESPPVNLDSFRIIMREAGAEDAVESMLELFLDDAPGRMEALQAAVTDGGAEAIAKAAHAYSSAAATIRATELASSLSTIENLAKEGDIEGLIGHIEVAQAQHTAVMEYLRAYKQ